MNYSLSLRPRVLVEIEAARDRYALVGHGDSFLDELESVFEAIQAMPLRFPVVYKHHPSGAAAALSVRSVLPDPAEN